MSPPDLIRTSQTSTPCPYTADCATPDQCQERMGCVLRPMSDWRADPTPYALRRDMAPRAVWPAGVSL